MKNNSEEQKEADLLESLRKKEEDIENFLTEAKKEAVKIIKSAGLKAKRLKEGFEEELESLKEELIREESSKTEEEIQKIKEDAERLVEDIKKNVSKHRKAATKTVLEAVLPKGVKERL